MTDYDHEVHSGLLTGDMVHEGQEEQHIGFVLSRPDAAVHIARHVKQKMVHIALPPPGIPPRTLQ